jgi:TRAP-type C4-dicarboxylate transport system substrate-binding protein
MKKIIGRVLVFMAVLALAGCAKIEKAGESRKKLTITLAHNQTSMENPYVYGAVKFKEEMESISNGQVEVILHHGTMGENESELIEKMEMGAIDIMVTSPGFMASVGIPEVDMLALLYLFDSFDHWAGALDGDFGNAMKDIIAEKSGSRFMVLGYWSASVRDYYGKKKVVTPADLRGLTLRGQSAQVMQQFWKNCGAIPTSIAWGELYQALQQGVVDAAENDYTNFMLKEHHKTPNGKYISETHHDFTTRLLLTSGVFWNKLNDEQKKWVTQAAAAATAEERAVTIRMLNESKAKVIADGAIVTNFDDIDIAAFRAIAIPIQDNFAREQNMTELLEMVRAIQR